jgi:hypothetical protein
VATVIGSSPSSSSPPPPLATYIRIFPRLSVLWSYIDKLIFSVSYLILFTCFQFHPYLFTSINSQFPVDLFFITISYSQLSRYRDGLRVGRAGFGSRQGQDFSLLHIGRGVKLITDLHLVPTPRMVELYLHSPVSLHGVVLN